MSTTVTGPYFVSAEVEDSLYALVEKITRERGRELTFEETVEVGVIDTAAILDEHVPGWHDRITRPINMGSIHDCVCGQVFAKPRFFFDKHDCGWGRGSAFFAKRGIHPAPFVFSAIEARPYWEAEIEKRRAG
jgi:hypothetical protein